MAQNLTQRPVQTFIKGLITEAGELTFPENASVDELNCDLFRDGSRRRRLGIKTEVGGSLSSFTVGTTATVAFGDWDNVGNEAGKEYLVVQVDNTLYFYNKGALPFSSQEVATSINLSSYEASGLNSQDFKCQFASIDGSLLVVNGAINPVYITEDSLGAITATQIDMKVRDFEYQGDKSTYDDPVATGSVTPEREYDTANTGWTGTLGSAALTAYDTANSQYPPLTHPWYSGKDASGAFSVSEWEEIYSGTSLIANGHFILDLFSKNRSTASGVSGLTTETEATRFTTVESFAGRVFYAGLTSAKNSGRIYFSRLLEDISEAGECYQQNDPTSEEISDLLDTDGGVIRIPDAVAIKKIYAFKSSLFVFAENGVWQITGVDNVFSPSAFSVSLVSDIGILSSGSFVAADGVPFWWSRYGIHSMSFNEFGNANEQNLSISTIQSYFNGIDGNAKDSVKSAYDPINKKIYWLYPNNDETVTNKYNCILLLDIPLQAFYPWKFEDSGATTDYIIGFNFYRGFGEDEVEADVVRNGDDVVVGALDVKSTQTIPLSTSSASVTFLARDKTTGKMTMAFVNNDRFLDWEDTNFTSYAETGYDFIGDLELRKNAPYITVYCRETETGWELNGTGYDPLRESSLLVSSYWDFKKTSSSSSQQAYRRKLNLYVDETDLTDFDSPSTVLATRLKMRGRGRNMRIRMESEQGKDFIFLGHTVVAGVNGRF